MIEQLRKCEFAHMFPAVLPSSLILKTFLFQLLLHENRMNQQPKSLGNEYWFSLLGECRWRKRLEHKNKPITRKSQSFAIKCPREWAKTLLTLYYTIWTRMGTLSFTVLNMGVCLYGYQTSTPFLLHPLLHSSLVLWIYSTKSPKTHPGLSWT